MHNQGLGNGMLKIFDLRRGGSVINIRAHKLSVSFSSYQVVFLTCQVLNAGMRHTNDFEVISGDESGAITWTDIRNAAVPLRSFTVC